MVVNKILRQGCGWGVLVVLFFLAWTPAQRGFSQITLHSDVVFIPVTVRDKKGRYVTDLRAEDFKLLDNGQSQPIVFFSAEQQVPRMTRPLALALALDASRSISTILHQQKSAVTSLLDRLGGQAQVCLISFSQHPDMLLDLTSDKQEAVNAFLKHQRLGGDTAIFDAISYSLKKLEALPDGETRKVVVVISDGQDTASTVSPRACLQTAEATGVAVYSILIPIYSPDGDRLVARPPVKGFREIAEESGGQFFQAGTVEEALNPSAKLDLGPVFEAIVEDLQHQYYLGFYPPEEGSPGFHQVEVRVGRKKVKLQQRRKGYTFKP